MAEVVLGPGMLGAALVLDHQRRIQAARDAVLEAATLGAEVVARAIPKDMGLLRQSAHAQATSDGAEILVDAPHAAAVELGSRPHWAPLEPLIDWVRRHVGALGLDKGWEHQVEDTARAIQAKIARVGTAPRWYMRGSLPQLERILDAVIRRRMGAVS